MNKVLVIVGPTASGKSDLAVKLAQQFNGEVISADSRQVYRGLNIGTGKITKPEMRGIPHHLLSVADPKERFTASQYRDQAEETLRYIAVQGKLPIIAGGTGLYIDAITCAINFPSVPPDPSLRKKLEKKSAEALYKLIQEKDPERAKSIDARNKVRLIRALEIIETLGQVPAYDLRPTNCHFTFIGLNPDKESLEERIHMRLLKRLPDMIKEAKELHQEGLTYKRMHELGLEYRYLALYLQGKLDKNEMVQQLESEIRKYAKRQMTWFKRNKNIKWFTPKEYIEVEQYVRRAMKESNPR